MVGKYKLVTLCTSRIYDPQVHSFIEVFNESIKKDDMRLAVFSLDTDLYWREEEQAAETAVFDFIPYEMSDLIIIMDEKIKSRRIAESIIARAREHGKSVIVMDGKYEGCHSISFDYKSGFEQVVRHVVEHHKVKRPHIMAGNRDSVFSMERINVFHRVIEENGIPFSEDMVSYGNFWAHPARIAAREILKKPPLPDAIICANDIMAFNVIDILHEAGIKVPDQVIVTGFDGFDEAYISTPALTTVDCSLSEFAETAAECTKKILSGNVSTVFEQLVIPSLVTNESCGCSLYKKTFHDAINRFNNSFYRYQDDIRNMREVITDLMTMRSRSEALARLKNSYTESSCCVVDRRCLEPDYDYFHSTQSDFGEEFALLYDSLQESGDAVPFDIKNLIPHIEKRLDNGFPLLVQSVDYMNRSIGYICYFFDSYSITDYGKTSNITEMLSMGLGGYFTLQYQRYLSRKVEDMFKYDALTGMYNRIAFEIEFNEIKASPENAGKPLWVVMADLDSLKKINDKLGHSAGDTAIAGVAKALKSVCPDNALFVRFGGDEMLAFIPYEQSREGIKEGIERLLEEESREHGFRISASVGIASSVISPDLDIENLISMADEDMYAVKRLHHGGPV